MYRLKDRARDVGNGLYGIVGAVFYVTLVAALLGAIFAILANAS